MWQNWLVFPSIAAPPHGRDPRGSAKEDVPWLTNKCCSALRLAKKSCAAPPCFADTVRVTLGPKSKSVLIQKQWGMPLVCNDGETIAKEFDLKDPEENLGAQMLRQAAEKTGDSVGDGTTHLDDPRARRSTRTASATSQLAPARSTSSAASTGDFAKRAIEAVRGRSPAPSRARKEKVAGGDDLGTQRSDDRRARRPTPIEKVGERGRHHRRGGERGPGTDSSRSSRACSSTAAISRPTSSPTPRK